MQIMTRHLVRPVHLNHHGCLYAGTLSEWMSEVAAMAMAAQLGSTSGMVMVAAKELTISRSIYQGDILELGVEVAHYGTSSITFTITGRDFFTGQTNCSGSYVFVAVDKAGNKRPHHLKGDDCNE